MTTTPPDNQWIEELCKKFFDAGVESVLIDWKRIDVQAMYTEAKAQIIAKLREAETGWTLEMPDLPHFQIKAFDNSGKEWTSPIFDASNLPLKLNSPQGEEEKRYESL